MDYEQLAEEFLILSANFIRNPLQKESETISHGELGVLGYLAFHKGSVTPGELKEAFGVYTQKSFRQGNDRAAHQQQR